MRLVMDHTYIVENIMNERTCLIVLAIFIFFGGVFMVARSASKREGVSLFKLLVWYDIKKMPYTTYERILRAVFLVTSIGVLMYAFR